VFVVEEHHSVVVEPPRAQITVDNRCASSGSLACVHQAVFSDRCLGPAHPRIEHRACVDLR